MARPRTVSDEDILEAAARVVARRGPVQATLAEIGEEVGVTASAIVQRFGTKRKLLLAISQRSVREVASAFAKARARHPRDAATAAVEGLVTLTEGFAETPRDLANSLSFLQLDLTDPEFRAPGLAFHEAQREGVRALVAEATQKGLLHRTPSPEALARALLVAYNGSLIVWALHGEGTLTDTLRRDLEAVLAPYRVPS
ncbi:MAG TPA: helix-turn-helix domain-containing protein [Candidatus Thermoplasmatota archaeon]|nr:helix-turn-helix domain-containing protein [Candidatus Thermoplasmatota archaeon]